MLSELFEQSINIIQSLLCTAFLFVMLKLKKNIVHKAVSYLLCSALLYFFINVSNLITAFEGIAIFAYALLLFVFSIFLFDDVYLKRLIISLIPFNASAVGSIISTNLISSLTNKDVVELLNEGVKYRVLTVIISNAIFISILAIIVFITRKDNIELDTQDWMVIGIVLFISILTFYFIYNIAFEITSRIGKLYVTLAVLGLTMLNVTAYVLLISLSRKNKLVLENTLLKQQIKFDEVNSEEIKRKYEQLHKMRHDFNNTLSMIQSLNDSGKGEQINRLVSEYKQSTKRDIVQTVTTDNDYINAIVNSKISDAKSEGIEIVLSIIQHIGEVNTMAICSLLGNMFDNAIEACKKCQDDRKIMLYISKKNGVLEIIMKNTISSSVLKDNPELITSKADKENHGYGTKIINEIAERNHGIADFYESGDMFCCHVIVSFDEK